MIAIIGEIIKWIQAIPGGCALFQGAAPPVSLQYQGCAPWTSYKPGGCAPEPLRNPWAVPLAKPGSCATWSPCEITGLRLPDSLFRI